MGLLDGGIERIFGTVFGGIYLDGQLVLSGTEPMYNDQGDIIGYGGGDPVPIKCQIDGATWAMQQSAGYVEGDVRIIVLSARLAAPITTDHRIEVRGETWLIQSADRDAAASHWTCRGRRA